MRKEKFRFLARLNMNAITGRLEFFVFQKGKFLPVAVVETTMGTNIIVTTFKGNEEKKDEIYKSFERFSGCS